MKRIVSRWLLLAPVTAAAFAAGGPPMISDDTETPGAGVLEINLAFEYSRTGAGYESELPAMELNLGLGERVELSVGLPWEMSREGGESSAGWGNTLAGVKWRFFDARPGGWSASIYPQIEGAPFRREESGEDDEQGTIVRLPLQIARDFDGLGVNVEISRVFESRGADAWTAGFVVGHEFSESFELLGESVLAWPQDSSRTSVQLNLGAIVQLGPDLELQVSVGSEMRSAGEEREKAFAYLGVEFGLEGQ